MPPSRQAIRVHPEGNGSNPLRWVAESQSRPGVIHIVELGDYEGNGACSCEHFMCRLGPLLEKGARGATTLRCKHIKACREALTARTIYLLQQQQPTHKTA